MEDETSSVCTDCLKYALHCINNKSDGVLTDLTDEEFESCSKMIYAARFPSTKLGQAAFDDLYKQRELVRTIQRNCKSCSTRHTCYKNGANNVCKASRGAIVMTNKELQLMDARLKGLQKFRELEREQTTAGRDVERTGERNVKTLERDIKQMKKHVVIEEEEAYCTIL